MLNTLIDQLEASLEAPASGASDELAARIAARLLAVSAGSPREQRLQSVRGLMVLYAHYYRVGRLGTAAQMLAAADDLSGDLDSLSRVNVLLRRGEFELLCWDTGAALTHTVKAMEIARASRLRVEEARAWSNHGMALQEAGLTRQADKLLAHALELLAGLDEPRLAGNIWAQRCQLGLHLDAAALAAARHACREALRYAEASPARYRDSMACTALCNAAALEILHGNVAEAGEFLRMAAARANVGIRPRWLIAVLEAMLSVREHNGEAQRAALNALLAPDRAPARAYVIETYSVMAAMYTSLGDAVHAHQALASLATERAHALWATLAVPDALEGPSRATGAGGAEAEYAIGIASMGMLERLAVTAELRDDSTGKHCYRVGRLSMLLARRAGLPEAELQSVDLAARLHDIGKFAIPDAILLKPGRLDDAEMHLMRTHTTIGADLLARGGNQVLHLAEQIARHHHEHWDGGGYPAGVSGESIPQVARIVALADVYDALSHVRPYKVAWSHAETMAYIRKMRGSQFDPVLADHFVAMMDEAAGDLAAFLSGLEGAAAKTPYVFAEDSILRALEGEPK